jgi:excisionase family DNA binding protein
MFLNLVYPPVAEDRMRWGAYLAVAAFRSLLYVAVRWQEFPGSPLGPAGGKTVANDPILTISEVAALLKIAQKTVYLLAQRGEVPGFKVGGQWRFSRAAIDSWIETASATEQSRTVGTGSGTKARRRRR